MATAPQTIVMPERKSSGLITAVAVGGGALLVWKGWSEYKTWKEAKEQKEQLKKDQDSTITAPKGKTLFDLTGKPVKSASLSTIATDIESGTSYPRDQDRVIRAFNSTPFGKVKDLENFYLEKYKEPLRERLAGRLSDENWIKIKYNFR